MQRLQYCMMLMFDLLPDDHGFLTLSPTGAAFIVASDQLRNFAQMGLPAIRDVQRSGRGFYRRTCLLHAKPPQKVGALWKEHAIIQSVVQDLLRGRVQYALVKRRHQRSNPYTWCWSTNFQIKFRSASTYVLSGSGSFELILPIIYSTFIFFFIFHFIFFVFQCIRSRGRFWLCHHLSLRFLCPWCACTSVSSLVLRVDEAITLILLCKCVCISWVYTSI